MGNNKFNLANDYNKEQINAKTDWEHSIETEQDVDQFNQSAEQLVADFLQKKKDTITTWDEANLEKEFKNYIGEILKIGKSDALIGKDNTINSIDDLFNNDGGLSLLTDAGKKELERNYKALSNIIKFQTLKEIFVVMFENFIDFEQLKNAALEENVIISVKKETGNLYQTIIEKKEEQPEEEEEEEQPEEEEEEEQPEEEEEEEQPEEEEEEEQPEEEEEEEQPEEEEEEEHSEEEEEDEHGGDTSDNSLPDGDNTLKAGHKDIATHYQDTDEEKAGTYKEDEKAKIKKKQDRIRAKRDKKVEKLQKKAEKAKENGHEKRAERKNAKAQEISREKEAKAASIATKNEVTTRKNVGKSFYDVIHNYKEQNIFTEDVNEDVLKRIPLETWREFNNLFGELLEKKPSDSTKCKDLMSGDELKKKLKSCKDASHLKALKKFWESCTVGQMKVIYEANRNTSDYDVTFMRKALEFARSDEGKEMLTGSKPEPFYFIADLDKMGNVNTDKVTISGSESQLYSAFLHNCTVGDRKGRGGQFEIIDGPETRAVIKQFFNLTKEYNPTAIQTFKTKNKINGEIQTLEDFGKFLYTYPDFSVFYVNKLNQITGGNVTDLFDLVSGKMKAKTTDQLEKERELEMDTWNSMEEWEEALDKLMSDPNMFAHLDQGVNTLGSLERHSKASLMMMLSNALDNQFLQLVTNFFGINGEKDVKIPASVKGQFLAKCRFDVRIFKDLHGFGSHLKGHKIAGGFGLEIPQDAINWLIGEIVPGFVGKLKDLKSGCFTLNIPILTAEFAKSLNADRIAQSNARNANAFQELLFDATAGLQFGWKLGKAPLPDSPEGEVIETGIDMAQKAIENLTNFNNSLNNLVNGIGKEWEGDEPISYYSSLEDYVNSEVDFDRLEGTLGKEYCNVLKDHVKNKQVTKSDFKNLINGIGKEWEGDEPISYYDSIEDYISSEVDPSRLDGGTIDNINNYNDESTDNTTEQDNPDEDPETKAEKEKFERFSANLTLEAGIGYKRDFLRGIEGINSTIKEELDEAVIDTFKDKDLTYDNFGEKFLDVMKNKPTYKNNADFFKLIADSFKDCITQDVWDEGQKSEEAMKDLQMIISEMVVGFVEYARADQVRQLDRRTKLTELHAGIGWHFDLRHLKRKDFFILKFSATVSSFMMKHIENSKKIQYMDASLRSGIGMDDYEKLSGNTLEDIANSLDKKIRLNGLIITSEDGKIKISVDKDHAPYILDGTVKTKVQATRVDQIINIYNNGCEEGKDFYYDGENLYLGDVKNISIARRNYLDTQQVYLFLCGAKGKPGVDNTTTEGNLPITEDIQQASDFNEIKETRKQKYSLDDVKKQVEQFDSTRRNEVKNNFRQSGNKVEVKINNKWIDIASRAIKITKDEDGKFTITHNLIHGLCCTIDFIDETPNGNVEGQEAEIQIQMNEITTSINLGLENEESGDEKLTETKLESREFGIGMQWLKRDIMNAKGGGKDYNDFLNNIGGGSGDNLQTAVEILKRNLKNAVDQKFGTRDIIRVNRKRKNLVGSGGGAPDYAMVELHKSWFEDILKALDSTDPKVQSGICERIAGIMSHEELLYMDDPKDIRTGLKFLVYKRQKQYESLKGPAGSEFPLPGIRDRLMKRMEEKKTNEILQQKNVIQGLFGYTAYYYKGNKIDEGKTYDATVLGQTVVLFGETGLEKITVSTEQKKAGAWLKANMEQKTDEYDQILGVIAKKLDMSIDELKNQTNGNLIFNKDGTLRNEEIILKDGTKVTIKADIVFYLYAACGNESLGLKLNEIIVKKPGGKDNPRTGKGQVDPSTTRGYELNVATESQSSTMVVTAEQGNITGRVSQVVGGDEDGGGSSFHEGDEDRGRSNLVEGTKN